MGNKQSVATPSISFFDTLNTPVFIKDLKGVYLDCNKSFELLAGKPGKEIIGKTVREVFPEKIANVFEEQFKQICENSGTGTFEFKVQFPDGKMRFYLIKYNSLTSAQHDISGISGIVVDVTAIKEADVESHSNQKSNCHQKQEVLLNTAETLKIELLEKQRELASHLTLLIQSEKKVDQMMAHLETLLPHLNEAGLEQSKLIRKQQLMDSFKENWIDFERKFDNIHFTFYKNLEELCPSITRNEKKLCAYLKMNITPTDIAVLEKKSLNSVTVAFSRLRDKFHVSTTGEMKSLMLNL